MELDEAEAVLYICDRFKCLPSQAEAEDASVMRMLRIEQLGSRRDEEGGGFDELG